MTTETIETQAPAAPTTKRKVSKKAAEQAAALRAQQEREAALVAAATPAAKKNAGKAAKAGKPAKKAAAAAAPETPADLLSYEDENGQLRVKGLKLADPGTSGSLVVGELHRTRSRASRSTIIVFRTTDAPVWADPAAGKYAAVCAEHLALEQYKTRAGAFADWTRPVFCPECARFMNYGDRVEGDPLAADAAAEADTGEGDSEIISNPPSEGGSDQASEGSSEEASEASGEQSDEGSSDQAGEGSETEVEQASEGTVDETVSEGADLEVLTETPAVEGDPREELPL